MQIEVRKASFSYGTKKVLDEVDLGLGVSSFCALIGPNGSGKSTLVKLMTGVLQPDSGQVLLSGEALSSYSPRRLSRRMAVIPSEHHFDFPFLVRDVVSMGRFPYLGPLEKLRAADHEIVDWALNLTHTHNLQKRSISELSSGERQRVLIARALAQDPRILILDEPNAHLDIKHQIAIFRLLKQLNAERNLTTLLVLHDLTMVAAFCETVALMDSGRILRIGSPHEIIRKDVIEQTFGARVEVVSGPGGNPVLSYSAGDDES